MATNDDVGVACPNLTVSVDGASIEQGEVVLAVTTANPGVRASRRTTVEASAPGWTSAQATVGALKPGTDRPGTLRLRIPADAGGTSHTITVTIDPSDTVDESAEEDNTATREVFIPPESRPDLSVRPLSPARVEGGVAVLLVVVSNAGTAPATETSVTAEAPGWTSVNASVSALDPEGRETVELRLDVPADAAGAQRLTVTVDPADAVTEASEQNNAVAIRLVLPPAPVTSPDLLISAARGRAAGDDVVLSTTVENSGRAAAPATAVEATAPGWRPARQNIRPLSAGDSQNVTLRIAVPDRQREATHTFTLRVDPSDGVREQSEANNVATATVLVPAAGHPDLTVRVRGRPAVSDDEVALTAVVQNVGDTRAPATTVQATAAGWKDVVADIPALAPGGEETTELRLAVPADASSGEHELALTVDPTGRIDEGSEANNLASAIATIPAGRAQQDDDGVPLWPFVVAAAALLVGGLAFFALRLVRPRAEPRSHAEYDPGAEETVAVGTTPPPHSTPGNGAKGPAAPPPRTVNTGFADTTGQPISRNRTLACARDYAFWLDVGEAVAETIETVPGPLPGFVPDEATIKVALFSLDGGFELDPEYQADWLQIKPTGSARRLFFPLRAPEGPGTAQVRCSIYYEQTLVQSRLVRARVTDEPEDVDGALESVVDYTIAPSLDPAHLEALPGHRLSVMLNRNADGSHGFSFVGANDFKSEASFGELELQDHVRRTRGALRQAAWGDEEGWEKQKRYLYADVDLARLRRDLITLARRGFRVYAAISSKIGDGDVTKLNDLMRRPGFVQIASKESPRQLLPASVIYDYMGFDTTAGTEEYSLCPSYADSTESSTPLEETRCFQGECPSRGRETVVCPSGFWGFRHALGVPVSVVDGADAAPAILRGDERALTVAVSTDPEFTLREQHERELQALFEGYGWNYAASREETLRLLKAKKSQIVYFYCHGGVEGETPYIQVGPTSERGITADLLFSQGIRWVEPRPLVFINGCQTTALEPEKALEFVSPLVQQAGAAGVIGTEITVFEPLARVFAKECLARFLAGAPIGEAVRGARLALLKDGNPLGLVYVPFVLAGLRLDDRDVGQHGPSRQLASEPTATG